MRMHMCEIQLGYSALAFARRAQKGPCSADAIKCTTLLLEANTTQTNSDSRLPAPATTLTSHKRKLPSDALEEDDSESSDDDASESSRSDDDASESSSSDDDDDKDGDREEMRNIGSLFLASEFNAASDGNESDDEDFDWDDIFAMD